MNPYDELANYRFATGRDYDKRSVETFRARALNLVDDLLNQVTVLRDELAAIRSQPTAGEPDRSPSVEVPDSWLGTGEMSFPPPSTRAFGNLNPFVVDEVDGGRGTSGTLDGWLADIESGGGAPTSGDEQPAASSSWELPGEPTATSWEGAADWPSELSPTTAAETVGDDMPVDEVASDDQPEPVAEPDPSTASVELVGGWDETPEPDEPAAVEVAEAAAPTEPTEPGRADSFPAWLARITEEAREPQPPISGEARHETFDALFVQPPDAAAVAPSWFSPADLAMRPEPDIALDVEPEADAEAVVEAIAPAAVDHEPVGSDPEPAVEPEPEPELPEPVAVEPEPERELAVVGAGAALADVIELVEVPVSSYGGDRSTWPISIEDDSDRSGRLPSPVRHWSGWLAS